MSSEDTRNDSDGPEEGSSDSTNDAVSKTIEDRINATDDGLRAKIVAGGLQFRPHILQSTPSNKIEEKTPAGTWLADKLIEYEDDKIERISIEENRSEEESEEYELEQQDDKESKVEENETGESDDEGEVIEFSPWEMSQYLTSFFESDTFIENYSNEPEVIAVERNLIPLVGLELEFESIDEKNAVAYLSNPFRSGAATKLYDAIRNNEEVTISYTESGSCTVELKEGDLFRATLHPRAADIMPFEYPYVSSLDGELIGEELDKSPYEDWLKASVESVEKTDSGDYEINVEGFNEGWLVEDPIAWEESHDTVRLFNTYSDGDIDELDYVYIRPIYPLFDDEVDTIESDRVGWEIAIEEMKTKEEKIEDAVENEVDDLLESVAPYLIYGAMFLIILLLLYLITATPS